MLKVRSKCVCNYDTCQNVHYGTKLWKQIDEDNNKCDFIYKIVEKKDKKIYLKLFKSGEDCYIITEDDGGTGTFNMDGCENLILNSHILYEPIYHDSPLDYSYEWVNEIK